MTIRIATWNINSVRARMDLVRRFCAEYAPDILCLQETKVDDGSFPHSPLAALGYTDIRVRGQRMHHGVAILSKLPLADVSSEDWQANGEARHIGVMLPCGIRLENVYVPAGGDVPDRAANHKFGQKLDFLARMTEWAGRLTTPSILLGDFNVAPLPSDVWNHNALLTVVSHTPVEVAALDALAASHGWIDTGRHFAPAPARLYTWWSYRASDWRASDRGRRLDHVWASPVLASQLQGCTTIEDARGWEKPSDHAPMILELAL